MYDPVCSDGIHPLLCPYFVSSTTALQHSGTDVGTAGLSV